MAVATWSLGGLFLGLAPTLTQHFFAADGALAGGLAITILCSAGLAGPLLLHEVPAHRLAVAAAVLLLVGDAGVWEALHLHALGLFFAATVIAGLGFGAGFGSVVRLVSPLAPQQERAGLLSAMYLVNYLAFGVPVLVAGWLIAPLGLTTTIGLYCALVAVSALLGIVAQLGRRGAIP